MAALSREGVPKPAPSKGRQGWDAGGSIGRWWSGVLCTLWLPLCRHIRAPFSSVCMDSCMRSPWEMGGLVVLGEEGDMCLCVMPMAQGWAD